MSDEMQIEGKSYISSKRASELSGYAQDYIGQLSRKSLIEARRIGGLWYVSMDSLNAYKKKAEEFKPEPPTRVETTEPGTLIFFDGKEYLSAARAAEITGYTQDYVGQLARGGTILSHQVGNRWYVERQSILVHKKEKDSMLAAVQSEAVGIVRAKNASNTTPKYQANSSYSGSQPLLEYSSDSGDLIPLMHSADHDDQPEKSEENQLVSAHVEDSEAATRPAHAIPIRRLRPAPRLAPASRRTGYAPETRVTVRRSSLPLVIGAVATIIIVLSVGYASSLRKNAVYAVNIPVLPSLSALPASAAVAFNQIGNILEPLLTRELIYQRSDTQ